jgi:hypothetical protein
MGRRFSNLVGKYGLRKLVLTAMQSSMPRCSLLYGISRARWNRREHSLPSRVVACSEITRNIAVSLACIVP